MSYLFVRSQQCLALIICLISIALLPACDRSNSPEPTVESESPDTEIEGSLVFQNVTLDQVDEDGKPLWTVKAKQATYTQDRKNTRLENPTGDLFQDGEVILQIEAESGEIIDDGEKILLKGQIIAKDIRNGAVFKGEELEWITKENLLIVRNNVEGNHPDAQAKAKEGRYFTRDERLELTGNVEAISKDPNLQMKTEHIVWNIDEQKWVGDKRIRIEQYEDKKVTDRAEADESEFDQEAKIVTLKKNAQLTSLDPKLLIASNSLVWTVDEETVVSDQPVRIVHQEEKTTVTANRGQVNLDTEVFEARGGVQAISDRNQAQLYANQATWEIPSQQFQAQGNVIYQQVDPPLTSTGVKAEGKLEDQTIVVTGAKNQQVVTEFVP